MWGWTEHLRKVGRAQSIPHPLPGTLTSISVYCPTFKEMTLSYPTDRWRILRPRAIHKARGSRLGNGIKSPNSRASNPSIICCFYLTWVKVPTASSQLMTVEERGTGHSRCRGQNLYHQGKGKIPVCKNRWPASASASGSSPALQRQPWSLGRSAPTSFISTILALLSFCPAQEESKTEAALYAPFLQEQFQMYSRTLEPHPLTLTQRRKVTGEAPTPRGRGKTKGANELSFPKQNLTPGRFCTPLPPHAPQLLPVQM